MKYKLSIIVIAIVLIASLFIGCSKNQIETTTEEPTAQTPNKELDCTLAPDITGKVLDVTNDNVVRVLVDSTSETISGQIWVAINDDTTIIDKEGNVVMPDDIVGIFEVGQSVSFASDGMIMESYPMQTSAIYVYLN